jgi:hypothetical protein
MAAIDPNGGPNQPTAAEVDLTALPIVGAGEPLIPHEVYIDVLNPGQGPCRALEGQTAGSGNGYVAEKEIEPHIWDHLVRVDGEAKLRQEQELETATTDHSVTDIGHTH